MTAVNAFELPRSPLTLNHLDLDAIWIRRQPLLVKPSEKENPMLFIVLAYLGGVLTILSPCILPVLPLVFSRSDQPFVRSGLPLLAGMALTFAAVATLAAVSGGWAAQANQYGRWIALALFGVFGLTLLVPKLAERLMHPLVTAGGRLADFAKDDGRGPRVISSMLLGVATGLLWAPCAGPILGLVLTTAALKGASAGTTSFTAELRSGSGELTRCCPANRRERIDRHEASLGAGEWIRRGIGGAILCGVGAMSIGLDTDALAHVRRLRPPVSRSNSSIGCHRLKRHRPRTRQRLLRIGQGHFRDSRLAGQASDGKRAGSCFAHRLRDKGRLHGSDSDSGCTTTFTH